MTGRTRPPAATKWTSAFTHAIVVWLRRNVLLEWLTRIAGKTHAKTGTLFCMGMARYWAALVQEWYYLVHGLSSINCLRIINCRWSMPGAILKSAVVRLVR